jgi:hypothetical protein
VSLPCRSPHRAASIPSSTLVVESVQQPRTFQWHPSLGFLSLQSSHSQSSGQILHDRDGKESMKILRVSSTRLTTLPICGHSDACQARFVSDFGSPRNPVTISRKAPLQMLLSTLQRGGGTFTNVDQGTFLIEKRSRIQSPHVSTKREQTSSSTVIGICRSPRKPNVANCISSRQVTWHHRDFDTATPSIIPPWHHDLPLVVMGGC